MCYSEKVKGMVTVVFPDLITGNIQRFTFFNMAWSKALEPVVELFTFILMMAPEGLIVNVRVTLPEKLGCFFK